MGEAVRNLRQHGGRPARRNWPHPTETNKPDDARLFDLMLRWAPEERTRTRILVQNPAELYGFHAGKKA